MNSAISFDPDRGIIHACHAGPFSAAAMQAMTSECIRLARAQHADRFLVDLSCIELDASLFDIYRIPQQQYATEGAGLHGRIAVLMPAGAREREAAQFYRTAARNRGHRVTLFEDRQAALEWLAGE